MLDVASSYIVETLRATCNYLLQLCSRAVTATVGHQSLDAVDISLSSGFCVNFCVSLCQEMDGVSDEWSCDAVIQLIELFREESVLWDTRNVDYKNRNKKRDAWTSIALQMQMDRGEVERKMRCIIGQFQRQLKKKSGQGADGNCKWFAFKSMLFLKDKTLARVHKEAGFHNIEEHADESPEDVMHSTESTIISDLDDPGAATEVTTGSNQDIVKKNACQPHPRPGNSVQVGASAVQDKTPKRACRTPGKRANKKTQSQMAEEAYGLMNKLAKSQEEKPDDEFDVFGKHVAWQIRNFGDKFYQATAKHRINEILFNLEMEILEKNSRVNNYHYTSSATTSTITSPPPPQEINTDMPQQDNQMSEQTWNNQTGDDPHSDDAFINLFTNNSSE